jgi:hypothetical protein
MNERIKELMRESGVKTLFPGDPGAGCPGPKGVSAGLSDTEKLEKFAELIVRMCADYADMAQDADCEYAGDYIAEAMGYGEKEGITTWRAKV